MSAAQAAATVVLAVASLGALARIARMHAVYEGAFAPERTVGRRVMRLETLRMGRTVERWLASVGLLLATYGDSTGAIACLGVAGTWRLGSWSWRRLGVAPWWAPSL